LSPSGGGLRGGFLSHLLLYGRGPGGGFPTKNKKNTLNYIVLRNI